MSGRKDEGALEELSVDAMNRLRASLGLAPLCAPAGATGPDAETVVPAAETPDTVAQRAAAAERAADTRRARALRARIQGLGAAILAEEGGVDEDAAHWLARTQARHAAAAAASAAPATTATTPTTLGKKRARRTGEEEESAGAVRLAAHAERLAAGLAPQEDVVLTLRDTGVLDAAGDDVNGAADVLESAAAAEDERRARAQAEARRTPASAKYDDDEFAELRADAAVAAADAAADASAGTGTGVAAEFYTSEEMAQLFRRKRRRTAAAGSGGGRRTTAESVAGAALEALLGDGGDSSSSSAAAAAGGGDKKEEEEEEGGGGGAPKRTREEEERATLGALERLTREQRTQERAIARERREALVRAHTDAGADDDDDAALYRALARTRAAAQQRAQQPRVEERVVQSLAARQQQPMDTDEARPSSDKVVVDDVSSFLTKIEATTLAAAAEAQEQQRQRAEAEAGRAAVKQEPVDTVESGHKEEDKDEDEDEDEEPFAEQPLYSVSAALAQLSRRGGVDKVTQNSTVLVGRKQDGVFDLRDDPAPHLKLEYLDADGQQLRPKEAHRLMSYIFHGRKPHQKKLEKLARQKEEARRVAEMESTDTPLHAVAAMERLQQETKQPYLVLSGKGAQTALLNLKKE